MLRTMFRAAFVFFPTFVKCLRFYAVVKFSSKINKDVNKFLSKN